MTSILQFVTFGLKDVPVSLLGATLQNGHGMCSNMAWQKLDRSVTMTTADLHEDLGGRSGSNQRAHWVHIPFCRWEA